MTLILAFYSASGVTGAADQIDAVSIKINSPQKDGHAVDDERGRI
jgi:hypothetical protein